MQTGHFQQAKHQARFTLITPVKRSILNCVRIKVQVTGIKTDVFYLKKLQVIFLALKYRYRRCSVYKSCRFFYSHRRNPDVDFTREDRMQTLRHSIFGITFTAFMDFKIYFVESIHERIQVHNRMCPRL